MELWDTSELFSPPALLLAMDLFCCEQYITYIGGQHCILGGRGIIGRLGHNPIGSCPSSHPSAEHWHRISFPTGPHSETGPAKYWWDLITKRKFFYVNTHAKSMSIYSFFPTYFIENKAYVSKVFWCQILKKKCIYWIMQIWFVRFDMHWK